MRQSPTAAQGVFKAGCNSNCSLLLAQVITHNMLGYVIADDAAALHLVTDATAADFEVWQQHTRLLAKGQRQWGSGTAGRDLGHSAACWPHQVSAGNVAHAGSSLQRQQQQTHDQLPQQLGPLDGTPAGSAGVHAASSVRGEWHTCKIPTQWCCCRFLAHAHVTPLNQGRP